jgi:transposase
MSVGRPTKLDDLVAKRITDAIAAGGSRSAAAEAARVHRSTLMLWLARGRKGEAPYSDFLDRIRKAEADAENEMVVVVREAAKKNWCAAAWWLERRRPKIYSLRRDARSPADAPTLGVRAVNETDVELFESLAAAARSARSVATSQGVADRKESGDGSV